MRRDRAAFVRLLSGPLSLALAVSGILAATPAEADPNVPTAAGSTATPIHRADARDRGPARTAERTPAPSPARNSAAVAGTGHITGIVTNEEDQPLEEVGVAAYRWIDDEAGWDYVQATYTGPTGTYDLSGLAAGTYRVAFYADYVQSYETEYWDDAATLQEATSISVAAGQTVSDTNAALAHQGRITGTVTSLDASPLEHIHVTAYQHDPYGDGDEEYWEEFTDAWTDSDGSYDLGSLPRGTYRVEFFDHDTGYIAEYWHDTTDWSAATDIEVTAGDVVSGIDAQLAVGASISGVITAVDGHPLEEIEVRIYRRNPSTDTWEWAYYLYTDENGAYDASGLPTGTYRIGYVDEYGSHATEYWNDSLTLSGATDVPVVAGTTHPGFDAQLSELGSITGTVSDVDGAPLEEIVVQLYRWSEDDGWEYYYGDYTDYDGSYSLGGIEPGTYRVGFSSYDDYLTEFWDDASTLAAASDIEIASDETVSHIDAQLATPATPVVASVVAPTIVGDPAVGSTLTASPGTWAPNNGLTYGYQWVVGGHGVPDATSPTYVPASADAGQVVQVRVRVSRPGYKSGAALSAATVAVHPGVVTLSSLVRPSIGPATIGVAVHATPGTWSPTHESAGYQWLIGGVAVPGATSATYVPVPSDVGKRLEVRVAATATGHTAGVATSAAHIVGKGVLTATKKPHVTGAARKNATLTVSPGVWSPSRATVRIQWYAGAQAIPKATATRLKLAGKTLKAVAGKAISVLVTVTAPGYSTVTTRLKVAGRVR